MSQLLKLAQDGKHINFLDGLRGTAVSYVLLYHFLPKTTSLYQDSIVYKIWDTFWMMGWSGVDLFFVLSGFLITGILYKSKSKKGYFKNFYIRRFFRIFPAYYALIVLAILYYGPKDISPYYWLYLSNFDVELGIPFNLFLCVSWSLSIEEQYYLFYPTLVYYLSDRQWIITLISLIVISISMRFLGHYFDFFSPRQMYHNTIAHFDGIALGGLLRMMIMKYEYFKKVLHTYVKLTPILLIIAIGVAYYSGTQVLENSINEKDSATSLLVSFFPTMYLYGYTLNSLLFGGVILWCILKGGIVLKIFSNGILRNIGKYSYAMYLFQYPTYVGYKYLINEYDISVNPIVKAVVLFSMVYIVARLSWLVLESPMNRIKERVSH